MSPSLMGAISWPIFVIVGREPLRFYTHSLGIVTGFAVGALLFRYRAKRRGVWLTAYSEALLLSIPGVIIGARVGWALPYWLQGRPTPPGGLTTLVFTNITLMGGFVGAWLVALTWLRLRRAELRPALDLGMESMAIGLLIARIGDVIVADHLGQRTTSPIGFRVPEGYPFRPNGQCFSPGDICHQTALYELVGLLVLLVGAWTLRRRKAPNYLVAGLFPVAYGVLRLLTVEPFRASPRIGGGTGSQWMSMAIVAIGVGILLRGPTPDKRRELIRAGLPWASRTADRTG